MGEYNRQKNKGEETGQAIKRTTFYYIKRLVFGGFLITALVILLQVALVLVSLLLLDNYSKVVMEGSVVIGFVVLLFILTSNNITPETKLTWSLIIALFPIGGMLLYLFVKFNVGTMYSRQSLRQVEQETTSYITPSDELQNALIEDNHDIGKMARYLRKYGNTGIFVGNRETYFELGDKVFPQLCEDLRNATEFIFLEFFMIEEGKFWDTVLDILCQKVKDGVEVRVMYDDLGCAALLPRNYPMKLKKLGINVKTAGHITPFLSTRYNNRDHRKVVVIDGKVAYTGGFNLCDEYINAYEKFGHWKDNALRVEGEAVKQFTLMFLQMWSATSEWRVRRGKHKLNTVVNECEKYIANRENAYYNDEGVVLPYSDGPHRQEAVAKYVYKDIISNAKDYVWITSPYFIPDHAVETLIMHTAKSGIDVRIVIPHIPDKKIPYMIARSYYPTMLSAGVKIYEYTPGFIHAKTFICDDIYGTVGTVNLDYRSLYLHYECGVFMYNTKCIADIKQDISSVFEQSRCVDMEYYMSIPLMKRLIGRILRVFGPLM